MGFSDQFDLCFFRRKWIYGVETFVMKHLPKIQEILREVLLDPDLEVTAETSAEEVDQWDSLAHVTILVKVEKAFGIRFKVSKVAELKNVGELCELIEMELND